VPRGLASCLCWCRVAVLKCVVIQVELLPLTEKFATAAVRSHCEDCPAYLAFLHYGPGRVSGPAWRHAVMRVFRDHAFGAPALQARWGGRGPVTDAASHRRGVVPQGFAGWVRTSVTWVVDPRSQLVSRLCLYLLHVQDHAARDRDLGCPDARLPGTEAKLAG
jgi:hypothetical protein